MTQPRTTTLVTGAAGGLGRAMAQELARRDHRLVLTDRDIDGLAQVAQDLPPDTLIVPCDLSDPGAISAFWAGLRGQVSALHGLINNAGLPPTMEPSATTDLSGFARTLAVNLHAPIAMAEAAANLMHDGGTIVNIASLAGLVSNPRRNAYGAAKAGLVDWTVSAAPRMAAQGIRLVGVAPGYVLTPMVAHLERQGSIDLTSVRRRVPLGRLARPDEIASVAAWLTGPEAAGLAGQTLAVDGGWRCFNDVGVAHPGPGIATPAETVAAAPNSARTATVLGQGALASRIGAELSGPGPDALVLVTDTPDRMTEDFGRLQARLPGMRGREGVLLVVLPVSEPGAAATVQAAWDMMLRCMAAELGPDGLRVLAVHPLANDPDCPQLHTRISAVVSFLIGPESRYMTGTCLRMNADGP